MNYKSYKLPVLILLPVFFLVSAFSASGYDWCFGDDGHVEIAYLSAAGCCYDGMQNREEITIEASSFKSSENGCGSCLDLSAKKIDAIVSKRLKRTLSDSIKHLSIHADEKTYNRSPAWTVDSPFTQPQPRVSQTILAHRTIVILI